MPFEQINFGDPIFESLRIDYPDFDIWCQNSVKTAMCRCAVVVHEAADRYAGIAILKAGEGPAGTLSTGVKISTFKVASAAEARGVADILLSGVFQRALELQAEVMFLTVLPNHEDLARYLELRGFRRDAKETQRGERIYVADLIHPERVYSGLNRLAYDLLADEYDYRSQLPGPNQESPEYLAELLTRQLPRPVYRILELGPGSGSVLSVLAKTAEQTIAVEISPKMAEVARKRAPTSVIVVADVLDLDFGRETFDGVYAGAFLHLFPTREAARLVRAIARWTKRGGAVFLNTTISDRSEELIEVKADYMARIARFRSRWTENQFRSVLESNGLCIRDRITTDERERGKFWVSFVCSPSFVLAECR
jgi:ubiquinone/menaquinone biosynthesis C-methylase UbiE